MSEITVDRNIQERVRSSAHKLIFQIGTYFSEGTMNEIIIVPLTIIARIIRTHDAIILLLKNAHPSEAAILTLTQFELRLDLGYTASDVKHAGLWLDHLDKKWSLTSVTKKLDTFFKGTEERKTMGRIFEQLSGIKHGNPVYSELGFPGRVVGRTIQASTGDIEDDFSRRFTDALSGYAAYQLSWSSQVLNKFTGQYAKIDKDLRLSIDDYFAKLRPIEKKFLE
jgi:hypothetical protein